MLCRLGLSVCLFVSIAGAAEVSYQRDIVPVLQRACQGCHQPNTKSSDLDLTTFAGLSAGGKRGPSAKPGAPSESLLVKYINGDAKPRMPLGQPPLPPADVDLIRRWIAEGAKDDSTASEARNEAPARYSQAPVITALAYSPDGSTIAVSAYREILLSPVTGNAPPRRLNGKAERLLSLAFSADGSLLIAGGGTPAQFGEVQVWDARAGKELKSVTLTSDTVFGASLSPDSSTIAVGAADNTVRILDVKTGKELHKMGAHENWVLGTVFSADGKKVVSVGRDRAAKLTESATGAFLENVNLLRGELTAVARHPKKDIVVIGGEDRIPYVYLMDRPKNMKIADDTTLIRQLERQDGPIFALAWSPDGQYIAVGGASPEVTVYDAESGKRVSACKGHSAGIYSLTWSPDSKTVATGGFDGQVRLYEVTSGKMAREFVPAPLETAGVAR